MSVKVRLYSCEFFWFIIMFIISPKTLQKIYQFYFLETWSAILTNY